MQQQSSLTWMIAALGPLYGLLIPATCVAIFVGAVLVVVMSRRTSVVASYLAFLPIPLLIGIVAAFHGFISSFQIIAMSGATPRPSDVAAGIATALVCPLVAIILSMPAYLVTACGLFFRALTHKNPLAK